MAIPSINQGLFDTLNRNNNNKSGQWGLQPIFQKANQPYVNTQAGQYIPPTRQITQNAVKPLPQQSAPQGVSALQSNPVSSNQNMPNIPFGQAPTFQEPDYDAMIKPALEGLTAQEGVAQSDYDAYVSQVNSVLQKALSGEEQETTRRVQGYETQKQRAFTQKEQANNEQRRLASELQQGIFAKYGTEVSTGIGAQAILGSQVARNMNQNTATYQDLSGQVDLEIARTREVGRQALDQINADADAKRTQARNNLQKTLADISIAKGNLQARKAELAYQAMEKYRQEVNTYNQRAEAFKQQIYLMDKEQQNKLALRVSQPTNQYSASYINAIWDYLTPQGKTKMAQDMGFTPEMIQGAAGLPAPKKNDVYEPEKVGAGQLTEDQYARLRNSI